MEGPCVLVSMCLMGVNCRYDGASSPCPGIERLAGRCRILPVCPEQLGGLPTPRAPSERLGDRVVARDGRDVTEPFRIGAAQAVELARRYNAGYALMKSRSPSCGWGEIYDGTFTGARVYGHGVTAEALAAMGVRIFDENHLDDLIGAMEADGDDTF